MLIKISFKTYFSCELYGEIRNRWKNSGGQNCRNFELVPKFCPPKFCPIRYLSTAVNYTKETNDHLWLQSLSFHHQEVCIFLRIFPTLSTLLLGLAWKSFFLFSLDNCKNAGYSKFLALRGYPFSYIPSFITNYFTTTQKNTFYHN